jgi:hypothetical protein
MMTHEEFLGLPPGVATLTDADKKRVRMMVVEITDYFDYWYRPTTAQREAREKAEAARVEELSEGGRYEVWPRFLEGGGPVVAYERVERRAVQP